MKSTLTSGDEKMFQTYLTEPVSVSADDVPTINIIGDLTHTVFMDVVDGTPSLEVDWAVNDFPVQLLASVNGLGKIEFYSSVSTANSFNREAVFAGGGAGSSGETEIRVYYTDDDSPTYLFLASGNVGGSSECGGGNAQSGAHAVDASEVDQASDKYTVGGYLGKEEDGTLAWAAPDGKTQGEYAGLFSLGAMSELGDKALLKCSTITSAPEPTSGSTYESGAPEIETPDKEVTMMLIAK
jgi:hypothetical protein